MYRLGKVKTKAVLFSNILLFAGIAATV